MKSSSCPICSGVDLHPFLQRSRVPVHQNLVVQTQVEARTAMRGDLYFVACRSCGFVFNQQFDVDRLAYNQDYDNTQSCSVFFDDYLDTLVHDLVQQGVRDCKIVEVGCGKGHFLRKLVAYPGSGNRGFGFDPTYVGPDTDLDGRLAFRRCFYDASCADIAADIVICRHVIEHVPDPVALLRSIHDALQASPQARVFFETPCVEWIFKNRVVWDFFYEHCSLFSAASLSLAFTQAGFQVEKVGHIFGGQYLWLEARAGSAPDTNSMAEQPPMPLTSAAPTHVTATLAAAYGASESILRQELYQRTLALRGKGRLALWGAGAKGATFASLLDPDCSLIDCVIDVNPNKQGRFLPGTGHPIIAPSALHGRDVCSIILMNPNYRAENQALLDDLGLKIALTDWSI
ncbi:MAG: class I SAM-dependent methyltransferase [Pseudomonadota bacterium]